MIIIIQNDPDVPAGTYGRFIQRAGIPYVVIRAWEGASLPAPKANTAVIVLGGAMGVHEIAAHPFLVAVKEYIHHVVAERVPMLGICLGGQLLAKAAGGTVTPNSGCGEKGVHSVTLSEAGRLDPIFRNIPDPFLTFQWHNDSFDLPPEAVHLASSSACPVQAFRVGNAYGLQFHPEVDDDIVRLWSHETPETRTASEDFVRRFNCVGNAYFQPSHALLSNFISLAGLP